ncbi:PREDICTED: uncharacterized protein LOC109217794 [Nicotiana attenuata]|uniref:Uncharacterized protein n=1 Tax=Nicotiana attenuata TaxID=49451 RepID=A0A1J6KKI0_NICAT|nr:PREDICTED: uncharacterized protein LOC109217794 [Nicotiana attenuata]OIT22295.1 hypothetical protein A4A49_31852 [Nicotiana attenuata]
MFEKSKKQTCFVTEEDISTLLQRYNATTLLGVLGEVAAQVAADDKIDWNALVKKSTTGITNAREYQMLWRHLAYRHDLLDKLDDAAQPLDDDSDLEYELEAFPTISNEASAEAAACVKVLIASGVPNDTNMLNGSTVEAPLTINIPNGQTSRTGVDNSLHGASIYGTNITVPVAVQKQPLSTVAAAEGLDTHGPACTNLPPRRKRKPWTDTEDLELIAAVQKCGEGNWANILKGDFKGDRTASQLSQRWAIIRKRQGTIVGNGSQLSEAQLATRRAMSLALDMPISVSVGQNSGARPSNSSHSVVADFASGGAQSQHQQDPLSSKSRIVPKKPLPKPNTSPDSMVKVAAVAAGARVATPSNGASLLKTVESKSTVQIPGGGPSVKSHIPVSTNGLPSNVHFIRTGLVSHSTSPSNASRPGTQQVLGHSLKRVSPAFQLSPAGTSSRPNASAAPNASICAPVAELDENTKQKLLQKSQTTALSSAQSEKQVGVVGASGDKALPPQVQQDKLLASSNPLIEKVEDHTLSFGDEVNEHRQEDQDSVPGIQVQEKLINDTSKPSKAPTRTENRRE